MSVTDVVIEELSEKVITHLVHIIQTEKSKEDKWFQKIFDQCIRYIKLEKVRQEDTEKSMELIQKQSSTDKDIYTLLLGILYGDMDEDELSMEHFAKFAGSSLLEPVLDAYNDFILVAQFFNMHDFSKLEKVGLTVVQKYSTDANIAEFLWQLTQYVEVSDNTPFYQMITNKARELFPEVYRIEYMQAKINDIAGNFGDALESYISVKDNLEKDTENPIYNLELASTWGHIADCYIQMENPEKALECCDTALSYDSKSEDFSIVNRILHKKAKALLLQNNRESALSLIHQILDQTPEDSDALTLLESLEV